jgi:transposase
MIMPHIFAPDNQSWTNIASKGFSVDLFDLFLLTVGCCMAQCGINMFTLMPDKPLPKAKPQALQDSGTFNPGHAKVRHVLFQNSEFFDPRDLPQLKYETLRSLAKEGYSVAKAAREFGLSRPTIYHSQTHFEAGGLAGLLPAKPGPKQPHKLTAEVLAYLEELVHTEPPLKARQMSARVRQRFKLKVHPRTIEKALKPKAKRGRQKSR